MTRYAAFLGSINVGGNRLKMDALVAVLTEAGFVNVATVVASGNVLFDHGEAADAALEAEIARIVKDAFGIDTFAAVRTGEEIRSAIEDNPFVGGSEEKFVHTLFLEGEPTQAQFDALVADHRGRGAEKLALGPRCLYIDFADGVADSKLTNAFMEKRLGRRGTARNVRSLARILTKMART
ncbi:hypothetical protein WSK_0733 [Novosphingobium sp. Rr 2-17]|uniref:DUF1697 domain-containing protein n=1 Tax=Novosphingobium sp. Rr 2-17 TaxID=555793 RepID=UPI0002697E5D|nr:DUF1697 domain-containing protein [Novosphingobium sp. Rr 2-17]EIZ80760.1 hypothetical protein WSK_0733 [Novosphingobium sp. Rr 2-17]